MAQRRFDVSKLEFQFLCSKDDVGKEQLVTEFMKEQMNKYASSTSYSISCCLGIEKELDSAVIATVEFTKEISYVTVNKILSHMIGNEEIHFMLYDSHKKEVTVTVMQECKKKGANKYNSLLVPFIYKYINKDIEKTRNI